MNSECAQCAELWRQYAQASGALNETEARLEAAGFERDHTAVKRLLAEVQSATHIRADMRLRIEVHENIGHPERNGTPQTGEQPPRICCRLSEVERKHIERIVAETGQNLSKAARILDIDRSTLYSKLKRYGLK